MIFTQSWIFSSQEIPAGSPDYKASLSFILVNTHEKERFISAQSEGADLKALA
jgi:hypothetical protein